MNNKELYDDMMIMRRRLQDVYLPAGLAIGLTTLMQVQEVVSSPVKDAIPVNGERPSKDAIRTYVLSMVVELAELVQCLDWKPWKNKKELDLENIASEFADILAFQGIIIKYLDTYGIGPVQLADAYAKKSVVNIDRFLGLHGIEYQQPSLLDQGEEK